MMSTFDTVQLFAPVFNVIANSAAAYFANWPVGDGEGRNIALLVAVDTVFRIAITHVLNALKIPYLQSGTAGHLLFPCLTLITQPLSVAVVGRIFNLSHRWYNRKSFITLFGYIALGWKANMMVKDVLYLSFPSLKNA